MTTPVPTVLRHARRASNRAITSAIVLGALPIPATPSAPAVTICQVTFSGNATGSRDVTASLTSFIDNHPGRRLCLNGQVVMLRAGPSQSPLAHRRQPYIVSGQNTIIRNLIIRGNDPDHTRWNVSRQHESTISINGGHSITFKYVNIATPTVMASL